jgi:drug/metabolite transporter (DMT)-like permease
MSGIDLGIVLLSGLLHAIWSVAIKSSRDPLAFNILQAAIGLPIGIALLFTIDLSGVPQALWLVLGAAAVAHTLYMYWMSRAYQEADLSLVYPIARSTPAFLPFLAVPLLHETIDLPGILGILVVVAGMWLVQTGGKVRWHAFVEQGTVYAYLTLAATVAYGLTDKTAMMQLNAESWPSAVPRAIVYFILMSTAHWILFIPLAAFYTKREIFMSTAQNEIPRACAALLFSFASYGLILQALTTTPVSYVVAVRQSSVIFVLGMSILWLDERPGWVRVSGALATVIGVALIGFAT